MYIYMCIHIFAYLFRIFCYSCAVNSNPGASMLAMDGAHVRPSSLSRSLAHIRFVLRKGLLRRDQY